MPLDDKGQRITPRKLETRYKKFFRETGLPYLSPHKCRHTYATYLLKGGADLRAVQELLGNSKVQVMEIYTHVDTGDIKKTSESCHTNDFNTPIYTPICQGFKRFDKVLMACLQTTKNPQS